MDKKTLQRSLEQHANGASFVTQKQVADFLGVSRDTARRKLQTLQSVDGKYYFVPEVAQTIFNSVQ